MTRNNDDLLSLDLEADSADNPPALYSPQQSNSPFQYVCPTEFCELPSKGLYYAKNHPLHLQEVIEFKHPTTKEEDILSSQTLLKKGLAIDRYLESIIVDKRIDVASLLIPDKTAILVAARIISYGPEYETKARCPQCLNIVSTVFDLTKQNSSSGEILSGKFETSDKNTFFADLPGTRARLECRVLVGSDETSLSERAEKRRKQGLPETSTSSQLMSIIVSVNGNNNRSMIMNFVESMPSRDVRFLKKKYEEFCPSFSLKQDLNCTECGSIPDYEVPFSKEFFWPSD